MNIECGICLEFEFFENWKLFGIWVLLFGIFLCSLPILDLTILKLEI
jgi:hypothetical protein